MVIRFTKLQKTWMDIASYLAWCSTCKKSRAWCERDPVKQLTINIDILGPVRDVGADNEDEPDVSFSQLTVKVLYRRQEGFESTREDVLRELMYWLQDVLDQHYGGYLIIHWTNTAGEEKDTWDNTGDDTTEDYDQPAEHFEEDTTVIDIGIYTGMSWDTLKGTIGGNHFHMKGRLNEWLQNLNVDERFVRIF